MRQPLPSFATPNMGGDDAFLIEVVQAFLEDSPQHVTAIQAGFTAGDAPKLMRAAHSLKGSSGNFGAARLQTLCAELELNARASRLQGLESLVGRVGTEYAQLATQLAARAEEATAAESAAR